VKSTAFARTWIKVNDSTLSFLEKKMSLIDDLHTTAKNADDVSERDPPSLKVSPGQFPLRPSGDLSSHHLR